jgi:hypothetical protein
METEETEGSEETEETEGSHLYFIAFDDLPQRSVERSGLELNTNLPGGRAMTTG